MNVEKFQVVVETTPNPASLRFSLPPGLVPESQSYTHPKEAYNSPLAQKIFGFPWAKEVYLADGFITVTKHDWVPWEILSEPLRDLIQEHLDSGQAIWQVPEDVDPSLTHSLTPSAEDSELTLKIKAVLREEIRPVLQMDGGDLKWRSYEDGRLVIELKGSCSSCPSSQITLKEGIEARLKDLFPEIREVIAEMPNS